MLSHSFDWWHIIAVWRIISSNTIRLWHVPQGRKNSGPFLQQRCFLCPPMHTTWKLWPCHDRNCIHLQTNHETKQTVQDNQMLMDCWSSGGATGLSRHHWLVSNERLVQQFGWIHWQCYILHMLLWRCLSTKTTVVRYNNEKPCFIKELRVLRSWCTCWARNREEYPSAKQQFNKTLKATKSAYNKRPERKFSSNIRAIWVSLLTPINYK